MRTCKCLIKVLFYCKIIFICWIFNFVGRTIHEYKVSIKIVLYINPQIQVSKNNPIIVKARNIVPTK